MPAIVTIVTIIMPAIATIVTIVTIIMPAIATIVTIIMQAIEIQTPTYLKGKATFVHKMYIEPVIKPEI